MGIRDRLNLAPVSLELGGKSPILVFDDADLDGAVNGAIAGNFGASGQSCVAGSRVLVQAGMHDRFISELVERAEAIRIGDPLDDDSQMGPLATRAQRDRIEAVVAESIAQGAVLHAGGARTEGLDAGWYYRTTVLGCADQEVACTRIELYGPVMYVSSFEHEADGLAMAHDTEIDLEAGHFRYDE